MRQFRFLKQATPVEKLLKACERLLSNIPPDVGGHARFDVIHAMSEFEDVTSTITWCIDDIDHFDEIRQKETSDEDRRKLLNTCTEQYRQNLIRGIESDYRELIEAQIKAQ